MARDTFLAHLGATLWGSMRHIVSPSLAEGAFHYYEKISFQLFFITQEVCYMFVREPSAQLGYIYIFFNKIIRAYSNLPDYQTVNSCRNLDVLNNYLWILKL